VIVNHGSGGNNDAIVEELEKWFIGAGLAVKFHLVDNSADLESIAASIVNGGGSTIVVAGGDGTVGTVAGVVARAGKILGVLPRGTLNNFSKDIGIPQELDAAVRVIAGGHTRKVDIASVNGRCFVNNSSIGLYPRLVKHREKQQRLGHGKWWAAAWAALRVVRKSSFMQVKLLVNGREFLRKTPFVFVGNNAYQMDLYNIGRRERLNAGHLSLYLIKHYGRLGVVWLVVRTLLGLLRQSKDFEEMETEELTIELHRHSVLVAADGEIKRMETPLHYRILPKVLTVLVPEAE
jgi:diacylglycerol kinase family enzyme